MLRRMLRPLVCCFYTKSVGADPLAVLGTVFFMQKVIGFNRMVGWPVHFTSRVIHPERLELGERSFPGWSQGCYIQAKNGIRIGSNLRMGPNVGLVSSSHSLHDYDQCDELPPIIIGNNVWLGMGVVVTAGVVIGDNVVIGANSVVTSNIPANVIAAGAPCRVLKPKSPYVGVDYTSA